MQILCQLYFVNTFSRRSPINEARRLIGRVWEVRGWWCSDRAIVVQRILPWSSCCDCLFLEKNMPSQVTLTLDDLFLFFHCFQKHLQLSLDWGIISLMCVSRVFDPIVEDAHPSHVLLNDCQRPPPPLGFMSVIAFPLLFALTYLTRFRSMWLSTWSSSSNSVIQDGSSVSRLQLTADQRLSLPNSAWTLCLSDEKNLCHWEFGCASSAVDNEQKSPSPAGWQYSRAAKSMAPEREKERSCAERLTASEVQSVWVCPSTSAQHISSFSLSSTLSSIYSTRTSSSLQLSF